MIHDVVTDDAGVTDELHGLHERNVSIDQTLSLTNKSRLEKSS